MPQHTVSRALRRALTVLLAAMVAVAVTPHAIAAAPQRPAATSQRAVVSQDCTSSRILVVVRNDAVNATSFTVGWTGVGTWSRQVAAGDRTTFSFTRADQTAYSFHVTSTDGYDQTLAGTLDCSGALAATVRLDCQRAADGTPATKHRLTMMLTNRSADAVSFTVTWPDRGSWTRSVPAHSTDDSLYWTLADGASYTLQAHAAGVSQTRTGAARCGLGGGTPGLDTQTVLATDTPIAGMNRLSADGSHYETYTGTAKSVRIPAMAVTNNGTVIAMADARVDGSSDLGGGTNNIQLAMVRSTDGGASFGTPRIVLHAPTTSEGYGDPSLLVDRVTGDVYAFANYSPRPGVGYYGSQPGSNAVDDRNALHLRYIVSHDDGATWSAPVDLNPQVRNPAWAGNFTSSGHGIQLASGRLVQPLVYHDSAGDHAADIYSDDHGTTWHAGTSAATGVNESKVIQRGNGTVTQNMRSNAGGNRWYASAPDVTGDWSAAYSSGLADAGCNGDEISYLQPTAGRPGTTTTAVHSNVIGVGRTDLTVRLSTDDGVSWPRTGVIAPGLAGYSTTAVLADGTLGDLYEVGDTGGIVFAHLTTAWIGG
jgi:sialidase-1